MAALDASWRSARARLWQDGIFTAVAWGAGLLGFMLPISIVAFLLYRGAAAITWDLLWQSPRGFPLGSSGGIRPAIEGSLALVTIGLAVSLPLAVGGAIYLTEYGASDRLRRAASFCGECLAGVPAIVYGLFGYSFLVVFLGPAHFPARRRNDPGLGDAADYFSRRLRSPTRRGEEISRSGPRPRRQPALCFSQKHLAERARRHHGGSSARRRPCFRLGGAGAIDCECRDLPERARLVVAGDDLAEPSVLSRQRGELA